MDTNKQTEDKPKTETRAQPAKAHHHKHKKPEGKKPVKPLGPPVETRGRAKSTLVSFFENKKAQETAQKKHQGAQATLGSERFKSLLSMFEKKQPGEEKADSHAGPKKIDPSRLSTFVNTDSSKNSNGIEKPAGTQTIQERIEALKNASRKPVLSKVDPILEERRKLKDMAASDDLDEFSDDYSDEDHLSDDGMSDSDSNSSEEVKIGEDTLKNSNKDGLEDHDIYSHNSLISARSSNSNEQNQINKDQEHVHEVTTKENFSSSQDNFETLKPISVEEAKETTIDVDQ